VHRYSQAIDGILGHLRRELELWRWRRAYLRQRAHLQPHWGPLFGKRALISTETDAEEVAPVAPMPRG